MHTHQLPRCPAVWKHRSRPVPPSKQHWRDSEHCSRQSRWLVYTQRSTYVHCISLEWDHEARATLTLHACTRFQGRLVSLPAERLYILPSAGRHRGTSSTDGRWRCVGCGACANGASKTRANTRVLAGLRSRTEVPQLPLHIYTFTLAHFHCVVHLSMCLCQREHVACTPNTQILLPPCTHVPHSLLPQTPPCPGPCPCC